ncbi:MAG: polysaccharide deacetylase family protein [Flavitalea sp.]
MFYLAKTPGLLKKMYPNCIWNFSKTDPTIYLTFDDGPHPVATPFVLDTLKAFNAKATFFCIGKNVAEYPQLYKRILNEGHTTGNHTFNHLNGWKTPDQEYIKNIMDARQYIDSNLFRPPYGKISKFQVRLLTAAENVKQKTVFRIIMWDVLSGDFDLTLSSEKCTLNVTKNAGAGSIVVFHDSEKAFSSLKVALPETLRYFSKRNYSFNSIR